MNIDKIKLYEPLFDSWYVDGKISQGRNMDLFKVYRNLSGENEYMALKTIKFPSSDQELSAVIDSGKFKNINDYLDKLEVVVRENMDKMMMFRNSKNVVKFENYKIVKESSCFYVLMLMELVTPLNDYLKTQSVTPRQVCKMTMELCTALESFREYDIMHHEVKHENIYVNAKGEFLLGDFGVATIFDSDFKLKQESTYLAPEVYMINKADTCSDIYSLGILMYKFLNDNRVPFLPDFPAPISLADREAAFDKRLTGEPMTSPKNADERLSAVVFKACAYDQLQRYQTPSQLRSEVKAYVDYINAYGTVVTPVAPKITTRVIPSTADIKQSQPAKPLVTESEKEAFSQIFEDDNEEFEAADNKKTYAILAALVVVFVIVLGFVVKGFFFSNEIETITTQAVIVDQTTQETTTTTAPTTTETTTSLATTTETTTSAITTTETTTTVPTTPTTEPSTTIIPESSTEDTTAEDTTAEETSSQEESTSETTSETTTEPTAPSATGPVLVSTDKVAGQRNEDAKVYTSLDDYEIRHIPETSTFDKIVIEFEVELGKNIKASPTIYIYEMIGSTVYNKVPVNLDYAIETSIFYTDELTCILTVDDSELNFDTESFDYYVCFEEETFVSNSSISLPVQIRVGE